MFSCWWLSAELLYLWCSLSALYQLKSLQRYWMNAAQVTSGLKFPPGFGAGVGIQPGRWILLNFHRILLLWVSCHVLGAVASRANWPKCHWGHWSGFLKLMLYSGQRGNLYLLAWENQRIWMGSTSQPSWSNSECSFWGRGTRRGNHIWVCVSSVNEGHKPKESSAGNQSSGCFRFLLCFVSGLSWRRVG